MWYEAVEPNFGRTNCLNFGDSWRSDFWIFPKKISIDLLSRSWNASYFYFFWICEIANLSTVYTHRNSWGWSKIDRWMSPTMSQFSQMIFDNVIFRISVNWASEKRLPAALFSYQKRSQRLIFWNWMPIMQANVGPRIENK